MKIFKKIQFFISFLIIIALIFPQGIVLAQNSVSLPAVGTFVPISDPFAPVILQGIRVFPDDPFRFDFLIDTGQNTPDEDTFKQQSQTLIRYFLTSLTVPDDHMWVNLSPNEPDRIIPSDFGITTMGRDLLSQDYILKQVTASSMHPNTDLGKSFWDEVHQKIQKRYGNINIPTETFNKVWIVPDKAVVYEHNGMAVISESHLKVMLEEDYESLKTTKEHKNPSTHEKNNAHELQNQAIRDVIIPALEKEVNDGKNFTLLRQIYHALILAAWYKDVLYESILGQLYIGQSKIIGMDIDDINAKEKIYNQYMRSIQKGVFSLIKEDLDPQSHQVIPKKYFSGGMQMGATVRSVLERRQAEPSMLTDRLSNAAHGSTQIVTANTQPEQSIERDTSQTIPQIGLIGNFLPLSEVIIDHDKRRISFRGKHVITGKEEDIQLTILASKTKTEIFEQIAFADDDIFFYSFIDWVITDMEDALIIADNVYGIQGLAAGKTIAVSQSLENSGLAILHEIGEAIGSGEGNGNFVSEMKMYLEDNTWFNEKIALPGHEQLLVHYGLRALFRERYPDMDAELSTRIKGHLSPNDVVNFLKHDAGLHEEKTILIIAGKFFTRRRLDPQKNADDEKDLLRLLITEHEHEQRQTELDTSVLESGDPIAAQRARIQYTIHQAYTIFKDRSVPHEVRFTKTSELLDTLPLLDHVELVCDEVIRFMSKTDIDSVFIDVLAAVLLRSDNPRKTMPRVVSFLGRTHNQRLKEDLLMIIQTTFPFLAEERTTLEVGESNSQYHTQMLDLLEELWGKTEIASAYIPSEKLTLEGIDISDPRIRSLFEIVTVGDFAETLLYPVEDFQDQILQNGIDEKTARILLKSKKEAIQRFATVDLISKAHSTARKKRVPLWSMMPEDIDQALSRLEKPELSQTAKTKILEYIGRNSDWQSLPKPLIRRFYTITLNSLEQAANTDFNNFHLSYKTLERIIANCSDSKLALDLAQQIYNFSVSRLPSLFADYWEIASIDEQLDPGLTLDAKSAAYLQKVRPKKYALWERRNKLLTAIPDKQRIALSPIDLLWQLSKRMDFNHHIAAFNDIFSLIENLLTYNFNPLIEGEISQRNTVAPSKKIDPKRILHTEFTTTLMHNIAQRKDVLSLGLLYNHVLPTPEDLKPALAHFFSTDPKTVTYEQMREVFEAVDGLDPLFGFMPLVWFDQNVDILKSTIKDSKLPTHLRLFAFTLFANHIQKTMPPDALSQLKLMKETLLADSVPQRHIRERIERGDASSAKRFDTNASPAYDVTTDMTAAILLMDEATGVIPPQHLLALLKKTRSASVSAVYDNATANLHIGRRLIYSQMTDHELIYWWVLGHELGHNILETIYVYGTQRNNVKNLHEFFSDLCGNILLDTLGIQSYKEPVTTAFRYFPHFVHIQTSKGQISESHGGARAQILAIQQEFLKHGVPFQNLKLFYVITNLIANGDITENKSFHDTIKSAVAAYLKNPNMPKPPDLNLDNMKADGDTAEGLIIYVPNEGQVPLYEQILGPSEISNIIFNNALTRKDADPSELSHHDTVGGIDLNRALLDLQREGTGIQFNADLSSLPFDPATIVGIHSSIICIKPFTPQYMTTLP